MTSSQDLKTRFFASLKSRTSGIRKTRWWRFGIVSFIYLLWVIWMNNYWLLLGLIALFDIYITGYVPLTWWKHTKNRVVYNIMSWIDAIVYALVLVYFVFNFIGQNYQIPSSSLEKTLLTGDYLWVNKFVYGPRVPMTPVHFPLVHNTMPFIGTRSYLDSPSLSYHRLPGLRDVELGDIVVFNFPAGDTVASKYEETPEYYELLVDRYGWREVNTNKEQFGEVFYRPVDRRMNFVKRCVGLPGQRIKIANDIIYIDGKAQPLPENVQFRYAVALTRPLTEDYCHDLTLNAEDIFIPSADDRAALLSHLTRAPGGSSVYVVPLTKTMIKTLKDDGMLADYAKISDLGIATADNLFPKELSQGWTLSNYGGSRGLLIPAKGMTVKLDPETWYIYRRAIHNYEGHTDSYLGADGKVYIDGKVAETYTFAMDYYFMMGDNRDLSQDSRFWGFVPEDHIVGTPMFVIISFDKDRSIFNGGIRWNRLFIDANPDK